MKRIPKEFTITFLATIIGGFILFLIIFFFTPFLENKPNIKFMIIEHKLDNNLNDYCSREELKIEKVDNQDLTNFSIPIKKTETIKEFNEANLTLYSLIFYNEGREILDSNYIKIFFKNNIWGEGQIVYIEDFDNKIISVLDGGINSNFIILKTENLIKGKGGIDVIVKGKDNWIEIGESDKYVKRNIHHIKIYYNYALNCEYNSTVDNTQKDILLEGWKTVEI